MPDEIYGGPPLFQTGTMQVCGKVGHFRAAESRPGDFFQAHAVQHDWPVLPESGHHVEGSHSPSHGRPGRCTAGRVVMTGATVLARENSLALLQVAPLLIELRRDEVAYQPAHFLIVKGRRIRYRAE